ncbi:MAG: hypothetical protein EHM70_00905 [Chloroflexota bacterium]|nr:MAG: hypothetical protein EHM70_00905 [Chloroflexota bacterium]
MDYTPLPPDNTRIGFHYFPDTQHYRESDLNTWLPKLTNLGASWLTLVAPPDHAIPEPFLRGLIDAGIEPVLHFCLPVDDPSYPADIKLLLDTYARWGVRYTAIFDRPNIRSSWPGAGWTRSNLVERFLDIYIPLAETSLQAGLTPVFPPLEPGGDYWDTAFLRAALRGIQRRGHSQLLESLTLGAYAFTGERGLNWGAGGPERWPAARPYFNPPGTEDQRGFRIFDWYQTIAQSVHSRPWNILLIAAGSLNEKSDLVAHDLNSSETVHTQKNLTIASLMAGVEYRCNNEGSKAIGESSLPEQVPPEVLACNFWVLSAAAGSSYASRAWFQPEGKELPEVIALQQWVKTSFDGAAKTFTRQNFTHGARPAPFIQKARRVPKGQPDNGRPISHYLLLPKYEWGIADWHLDVIRPFVKKYQPTVGFSLEEAAHAQRVTVIGGTQSFPEADLQSLRQAGCVVDQISGDGTSIATQLASI